jgi:predicted amidophosphoribosyltransferase
MEEVAVRDGVGGPMQCALCGAVVPWNPVGICPSCADRLDEEFQVLREELERSHGLSAPELEARTGVPLAHIQWLVRNGRLMGERGRGVCPVCGAATDGGLCPRCQRELRARMEKAPKSSERLFHTHEEHPSRTTPRIR